jgi:hypothetical protein
VASITPDTFKTVPWQTPWRYAGIGEGGGYERELDKEVGPGHPLYNARTIAVGARVDQDDVLFLVPDAPKPLAVAHLTWHPVSPGDPNYSADLPHTIFYSSLDDWLSRGMAADHAEFIRGDAGSAADK